jgi:multimeric flavodoxin WrbA
MDKLKKALLIIGSPKLTKSASESLGVYLLNSLCCKSVEIEKVHIHSLLKSEKGSDDLLKAIDKTDVIILSSPLYVDSPPAAVIKAMELIVTSIIGKNQKFVAISNCGFPEAHHNDTALDIYKNFAQEAGFEWLGGLALGAGPSTNGRELTELGGMAKNIRDSLDIVANDICESKKISQRAIELMRKSIVLSWTYVLLGGFMWKHQAKKNGVIKKIKDQPYKLKV